ncbi:MAG: ABC transporter permease [Alphaproteobacteria bacterium]|nr:ABC transporter permease [Alphaproteobacteria bacterium]
MSVIDRDATAEPALPADDGRSEAYRAFLRAVRVRRWMIWVSQALLLVLFLVLWEIAPRAHWVNPMLTSYPSAIVSAFDRLVLSAGNEGNIFHHTWVTLVEAVVGFVVSMILGLAVAVALWWSTFLYKVIDPFLVVANALPKIALVPIFYIWLGDTTSIYAMAIAIAVFITILMIFNGFQEIDPNKVKLVRTFGATRAQILAKVVLPGSVPTMIAAMKINVGLALVGVIVGEFQSSKAGLGYLIVYGSQIYKMDLVMTSVSILAVMSTVMYLAIAAFERRIQRRRQ